jgi:hypothetical protein
MIGGAPPRVPLPKIVLKARPTAEQLADRLRPTPPEGLEVYLDAVDISGEGWLHTLRARFAEQDLPSDFALIVEGPVRSLDGAFFDLSADTSANREVVDRLAIFGGAVGAHAACIHLIAPVDDLHAPTPKEAATALELCLPLAERYARVCREAGLVPTVENIPPILRQREGRFMRSPIGGPPEHLRWLADRVEGLRTTVDTSHAQLFLNCAEADPSAEHAALAAGTANLSPVRTLPEYLAVLAGRIESGHVSDADGLLGEGLPYGEGGADLDAAVEILLDEARWIVTETLEPNPDRSENMRAAEARIAALRARRLVSA